MKPQFGAPEGGGRRFDSIGSATAGRLPTSRAQKTGGTPRII